MLLGPLQDEFRKHTQEAAQIVALRENAINMGLKGDALVAGVIDNSAAATKEAQGSISEMAEKQAKQQADDALFMAMLGDLDAQIADNERVMGVLEKTMTQLSSGAIDVDEAISRPEVLIAIRDWEKRTGRSFNPENDNAAEELMVIMQEQHDIVATDTILRKNEFNRIGAQVSGFEKRFDVEPVEVTAEVRLLVGQGASQATAVVHTADEQSEISLIARDSRDEHRGASLASALEVGDSTETFDDLFALDKVAELSGLAVKDFDIARAHETEETTYNALPSPDINVDFS